MNLDEAIKDRRSIRKYNDKLVELTKIHEIIEAGMWAPTACNKQEYKFIYINNKEKLQKIKLLGSAHFLESCNQAILVLYSNRTDNIEYRDNIQSGAAIIQNMLLKAHSIDIGTCWICNLPLKRNIRKLFNIPNEFDPIAIVSLGYYENTPKPISRKYDIKDILYENEFNDDYYNKHKFLLSFKLKARTIARFLYLRIPKNRLVRKIADRFEKKFTN